MCVTLSNEVLSVNSSGTDVVLAQFPSSGDLTSFGLTPSIIKTIAIPNDIQEWPTTALNGCTNLEKIAVFGPEVQEGTITIDPSYGFYNLEKLTSIQFPSTVAVIGDPTGGGSSFPPSVQSVSFPPWLTTLKAAAFRVTNLAFVDFSRCRNLHLIEGHTFRGTPLRSLDLSACSLLCSILNAAFFFCNQLHCVTFPMSLTRIDVAVFETGTDVGGAGRGLPSPVKTIIWKGRSTRPAIDNNTGIHASAFRNTANLDTLVSSGQITEIFVS